MPIYTGNSSTNAVITSTGIKVPAGNTASRPGSPVLGTLFFNTTIDAYENYTSIGWLKVSAPIPTITSVSGTIYSGITTNLTITGSKFGSGQGTVKFTSGGSTYSVNITPSSDTQLTVAVPSGVYGLSSGTVVDITFTNADNGVSSASQKTIAALPTGGTISTSGSYRIHKFTSSGTFYFQSSLTVGVFIVGGGGAGGSDNAGGGGAGGVIDKSSHNITSGSYNVIVGAGNASPIRVTPASSGTDGAPYDSTYAGGGSSVFGMTALGGGNGGGDDNNGYQGGSGGAAADNAYRYGGKGLQPYQSGDSGTYGYGNRGGNTIPNAPSGDGGGGGGGGAGGRGKDQGEGNRNGGVGRQFSIDGNYYAGGGGGNGEHGAPLEGYGVGGAGGGGNASASAGGHGSVNTGGGGGGGGTGGNGGSGVVFVYYNVSNLP